MGCLSDYSLSAEIIWKGCLQTAEFIRNEHLSWGVSALAMGNIPNRNNLLQRVRAGQLAFKGEM